MTKGETSYVVGLCWVGIISIVWKAGEYSGWHQLGAIALLIFGWWYVRHPPPNQGDD